MSDYNNKKKRKFDGKSSMSHGKYNFLKGKGKNNNNAWQYNNKGQK